MDSYTLNSNIYFHTIDGHICISDFNNNKIYILSKNASAIWESIINGADLELICKRSKIPGDISRKIYDFAGILASKKIITKSPNQIRAQSPLNEKLKPASLQTDLQILFEDSF